MREETAAFKLRAFMDELKELQTAIALVKEEIKDSKSGMTGFAFYLTNNATWAKGISSEDILKANLTALETEETIIGNKLVKLVGLINKES